MSSSLLVLSWVHSWTLKWQHLHSSWSLSSFKWCAHSKSFIQISPFFPSFQITHFCSTCLFSLSISAISSLWCPFSFAALIFNFNRCKLVVLAVLVTSSMGINTICCVLEFISMGLLFKMGFYVSLAWFLCFGELLNVKNIDPILKKCLIIFQLLLNPQHVHIISPSCYLNHISRFCGRALLGICTPRGSQLLVGALCRQVF